MPAEKREKEEEQVWTVGRGRRRRGEKNAIMEIGLLSSSTSSLREEGGRKKKKSKWKKRDRLYYYTWKLGES